MPMPVVKSFSGGEVTPEMFGRFDLAKQQTGLALCSNFWILPHGVAQNRAGFEYVNEVKYSDLQTRIIEFSFNSDQTYVLELGNGYLRIHTQGSTLVEPVVAITGINQGVPATITAAHNYANGDWVYVDGITDGPYELNGRFLKVVNSIAGVSFRVKDLADNNINTVASDAWAAGGEVARVLELAVPYQEADLFQINFTQSNDVLTLVHPNYPPAELRRLTPTTWQYLVIDFLPTTATPAAPTFPASVNGANPPITQYYTCTNLATESLEESLPSPAASFLIDLTTVPSYLDIQVPNDGGVDRCNLYKLRNGLFSFVGQTTPGGTIRDTNLAPDAGKTAPFLTQPFTGAGNYPGCVTYYENRRVFAGTDNRPQNYWLTASGSEKNMSYSIPTRDDDAITGRLVAHQANRIRHLAPLAALLALTSGGEWKFDASNTDILTPDSTFPKQGSTEGCARVKMLTPGDGAVFVQEAGSRLRHINYKWQSNGWAVDDITIMAPHLFDDFQLVDLAFQKTPFRMVWAARSDGKLIGLTFHPEHEVVAYHQHTTDGLFESTACVKEGGDYPLYVVVKRNINSRNVRYIERLHSRRYASLAASFVVDAGVTYSGSPATTISGLWHLLGEEVTLLVDGAVHPVRTVSAAGEITLEQGVEGSLVHVGLPYVSQLKTVPTAFEGIPAAGTAFIKNATGAYLRVDRSSGLKAGPSFTSLREYPPRANEVWGSPPDLKSTMLEIPLDPDWNALGQVCVQQDQPLPTTVLGMVIDFASEGT